ncbi:MAG: T9SS type A sorting domain-containing protein [Calditrichales bacterium]|nr:MAG: T9SS type A sorting domain-containing protein [Calditrichales bacterium]
MRKNYRLILNILLMLITTSLLFAQDPIPNPGFENWTLGSPDDWITYNVPGYFESISQSTDSHSGTYAAKGEVKTYNLVNLPPMLSYLQDPGQILQNFTRFTGYYQMTNNGEDVLLAYVLFYDAQSYPVAVGSAELESTNGSYQFFAVDMDYTLGSHEPITGVQIIFVINVATSSSNEDVALGSSFLLDDLAFDMASAVDPGGQAIAPLVYALDQNYPNPFNPVTTIGFSIPQAAKTTLTVYNSLGQVVRTILNTSMPAGKHQVDFDAGTLPSGIYYYQLESGSYKYVRKMMLVK